MSTKAMNGLASAMISMGLMSGPMHVSAYSSTGNRAYMRQAQQEPSFRYQPLARQNYDLGVLKSVNETHQTTSQMMTSEKTILNPITLVLKPGSVSSDQNVSSPLVLGEADIRKEIDLEIVSSHMTRELMVIDELVFDKHVFYRALKPGVDIVEIKSNQDGLTQLKSALKNYKNLQALHVVSHANDGELLLGSSRITASQLRREKRTLYALDEALNAQADIHFYGCNLAKTQKGKEFLSLIANEAHVDVAASNDSTGNKRLGANWDLEIVQGRIETETPFDRVALNDVSHVLGYSGSIDFLTVTNVGVFRGAGTIDAQFGNAGGYTLIVDGSERSTYAYSYREGEDLAYSSPDESSVTLRFSGSEPFTPSLIYLFNYAGEGTSDTFIVTSDLGGEERLGPLEHRTGDTFDISSFGTGVREIIISVEDGAGFFGIDDFGVENVGSDTDGDLIASSDVIEPVDLPLSMDSSAQALDVFDFTIMDGGAADAQALTVSDLSIRVSGSASDNDIQGIVWRLSGRDVNDIEGVYDSDTQRLIFEDLNIFVADGGLETYTLNAYYANTMGVTAGNTIILSIDGDRDLSFGSGTVMTSTSDVTNGAGLVIRDDVAPQINGLIVPSDGLYKLGDTLDFIVNYDENVVVERSAGTPRLMLTIGSETSYASYVSGDGSAALVFRYTIQLSDLDTNGIELDPIVDSHLGRIEDQSGNEANDDSGSLPSLVDVLIDAEPPVVSQVTAVPTPTNNSSPSVRISSTEMATIAMAGACGLSSSTSIPAGEVSLVLTQGDNITALADGRYTDCRITVTDRAGNVGNVLTLSEFLIDTTAPLLSINTGKVVAEGDLDSVISTEQLQANDAVSNEQNIFYTVLSTPVNGDLRRQTTVLGVGDEFTQEDVNNNALRYDHDDSQTLQDAFRFNIRDSLSNTNDNSSSSFLFAITVLAVNDPPLTVDDTVFVDEDTFLLIDILANDTDPDGTLSASSVKLIMQPAHGETRLNVSTGTINYTPNANFNGLDSFTYTVEDDAQLVSDNVALVTITVNAQNDAPEARNDLGSTDINTDVSIDVVSNDVDIDSADAPDPDSLVIVSAPANGLASVNAGRVDYSPTSGFSGTDTFTYTINDTRGESSNVATVFVNVIDTNILPVGNPDAGETLEDTPVELDVLGNDSDMDGDLDITTVIVINEPENGSAEVDSVTGFITYTPKNNYVGDDGFSYIVQDNSLGTSNITRVDITINSVNDAPIALDDEVLIFEDGSHNINVLGNDSDIDGTLLPSSLALVTLASSGVATIDTSKGLINYTPGENFFGSDSFSYYVQDNEAERSNVATVNITVDPINDAPIAQDDNVNGLAGESQILSVLLNDSDIDGTLDVNSITIVTPPSLGSLTDNNDGTLTYTANNNARGSDSFTYTVADNSLALSNSAVVSITFIPAQEPTISGVPSASIEQDTAYEFVPTSTVSSGFSLVFSIVNQPSWAQFNSASGALSGTPTESNIGTTQDIVIRASDGFNQVSLDPFNVTVSSNMDTDEDSISDYQEEIDGTDPNDPLDYLDITPPQLTAPVDVIFDSDSLVSTFTKAQILGLEADASESDIATLLGTLVTDNVEGQGCCLVDSTAFSFIHLENVDNNTQGTELLRLAPGRHNITWTSSDRMGNTSQAIQQILVRPLVSLTPNAQTAEGNEVSIGVRLNGQSPIYPLTIPYLVSNESTASSSDHDLVSGHIVFEDGETRADIRVNITEDTVAESEEFLVVTLDDRTEDANDLAEGFSADIYDINRGVKSSYRLSIVESNILAQVNLQVSQGAVNTRYIEVSEGDVTVRATVKDANLDDVLTRDWSGTDSRLMDKDASLTNDTFIFDPSNLSAGAYNVELTVTDSEFAQITYRQTMYVVDARVNLNAANDSDGDGVDDVSEGYGDSDSDGLANYLDAFDYLSVLTSTSDTNNQYLIECDPGLVCGLGRFALLNSGSDAVLSDDNVLLTYGIPDDTGFIHSGGVFDFDISALPLPGQSVRVVLPLRSAIAENARYRKYHQGQWQNFVENSQNAIHSAAGGFGLCPPPGDSRWEPGLIVGYECLQLTIEDGGANDADGHVNRFVSDPGSVAVQNNVEVSARSGGGSMSYYVLLALGLISLLTRKINKLAHKTTKKKTKKYRYKDRLQRFIFKRYYPISLFLFVVLSQVSAQAFGQWDTASIRNKSFIEVDLMSLDSGLSESHFVRGMNDDGVNDVLVREYQTSRSALGISLGYQWSKRWAMRVGYIDLGETDVLFSATHTQDDVLEKALENNFPLSGAGWHMSIRARQAVYQKLDVFIDGGLFFLNTDIEFELTDASIKTSSQGSLAPILAVGVDYQITQQVALALKYHIKSLDSQNTSGLGVALRVGF